MKNRKKILFVVNTLSRAGAETALLQMLRTLDSREYELFLYVIMGQGEMIEELPSHVKLLNSRYSSQSVLTKKGKRLMVRTILTAFFRNGRWFESCALLCRTFFQ